MSSNASLSILNTGAGDIEINLTDRTPEEEAAAVEMLVSMRDRGYAILVEMPDGKYARAHDIDGKSKSYRIKIGYEEAKAMNLAPEPSPVGDSPKKGRGRPPRTVEVKVPISKARATGIARSAGG